MFLLIDNYDSFTYNLYRYFEELDEEISTFRNDKITIGEIEKLNPEAIILSPGPKSPLEAGICLDIIDQFKGKIPILGICLGHQAIGYYFGAKIIKGDSPVHGKISLVTHNIQGIFEDLPNPIKVTRYHSLKIDENSLPKELTITAKTIDGVIMGIKHNKFLIEGVQFHPEAELTEFGHELLKNFIIQVRNWRNSR